MKRIGSTRRGPAGSPIALRPHGSGHLLANRSGPVTLARAYQPFGSTLTSAGSASTIYHFTGEQRDGTGLVYLRARYYGPGTGRFVSRDIWKGDPKQPMSHNAWAYVNGNPVSETDPAGMFPEQCQAMPSRRTFEQCVLDNYGLDPISSETLGKLITGERGCYGGEFQYRAPGYIEGAGGSILTTWAGLERVYSFARMEQQSFVYLGFGVSDAVIGAGVADYAGAVVGLPNDRPLGETYRGLSLTGQGGISLPLGLLFGGIPISAGDGLSGFISLEDPEIRGANFYVGGTLSKELLKSVFQFVDVGLALVQYYPEGLGRPYATGKKVNRAAMLADILTSPSIWFEPVYPLAYMTRIAASVAALHYAGIYEELGEPED